MAMLTIVALLAPPPVWAAETLRPPQGQETGLEEVTEALTPEFPAMSRELRVGLQTAADLVIFPVLLAHFQQYGDTVPGLDSRLTERAVLDELEQFERYKGMKEAQFLQRPEFRPLQAQVQQGHDPANWVQDFADQQSSGYTKLGPGIVYDSTSVSSMPKDQEHATLASAMNHFAKTLAQHTSSLPGRRLVLRSEMLRQAIYAWTADPADRSRVEAFTREARGIPGLERLRIMPYEPGMPLPSWAILLSALGRPDDLSSDVATIGLHQVASFHEALQQAMNYRLSRGRIEHVPLNPILGMFVDGDMTYVFFA